MLEAGAFRAARVPYLFVQIVGNTAPLALHRHGRAALKAPTHPSTTHAPTEVTAVG